MRAACKHSSSPSNAELLTPTAAASSLWSPFGLPSMSENREAGGYVDGWAQASQISLIRTATYSLYNRLRSIEWDARRTLQLLQKIAPTLPIFGNARAGSWYVTPECQTCRFRSNDGHYNQWRVSTRCINMPLLRDAVKSKGVVVVDATRAGKAWPDALSKTLPMWCAVVSAVAAGVDPGDTDSVQPFLHLHPDVPKSEEAAIRKRLPGFVEEWQESGVDLSANIPGFEALRDTMLRPIWVRADADFETALWDDTFIPNSISLGFIPLVCLSASLPVAAGTRSFVEADETDEERGECYVSGTKFPARRCGFSYIQGAGDDQEAWAHGITPEVFWEHRCEILTFARDRENWVPSDSRWRPELSLLLRKSASPSDMQSTAEDQFGKEASAMLRDANLLVVAATQGSIRHILGDSVGTGRRADTGHPSDDQRASSILIALSSSQSAECSSERENVFEQHRVYGKVHWFNMADSRGKPDFKRALIRIAGEAIALMNRSSHTTVICDSGHGDWAAGLAIAFLLQRRVSEEMREEDRSEKHVERSDTITKDAVRRLVLRLATERADLEISRRTLQQVHSLYMAPQRHIA